MGQHNPNPKIEISLSIHRNGWWRNTSSTYATATVVRNPMGYRVYTQSMKDLPKWLLWFADPLNNNRASTLSSWYLSGFGARKSSLARLESKGITDEGGFWGLLLDGLKIALLTTGVSGLSGYCPTRCGNYLKRYEPIRESSPGGFGGAHR